jgi:asparagine N-glycosylation enzyme membrane subunit Stt3
LIISGILAFYNKKRLMFLPIMIWLLWTTFYIRTSNVGELINAATGEPVLGPDLDPFLFTRHAHEIVEGRLENPDMMRLHPFGTPNYAHTNLEAWMIACIYWLTNIFNKNFSVMQAAIYSAPVWFTFSLIPFFLMVFFLFSFTLNKNKSLIGATVASFFYSMSPIILSRSVAGIPESEGHAFLWFFLALLFFILAWKQDFVKNKRNLMVFAVLTGVFTGLMAWTWGGNSYIFMVIAFTSFLLFLFEKEKLKNLLIMGLFVVVSFLIIIPRTIVAGDSFFLGVVRLFTSLTDTGLAFGVFGILFLDYLLHNTDIIKKTNKIKVPNNLKSILIAFIFGIIFLLIVRPSFLISLIPKIFKTLLRPFGTGRVGVTVAEHRIPYFGEMLASFGVLFWVFFFSVFFVFYETTKNFQLKQKIILNSCFTLFILSFTFSRIDANHILNGVNFISQTLYFGGIFIFGCGLIYVYWKAYGLECERALDDFKKINFNYVFIFASSVIALFSLRVAVRFFMISTIFMIPVVTYVPFRLWEKIKESKDEVGKIILWTMFFIFILLLGHIAITNTLQIKATTKGMVPSIYNQQWHYAMHWVSENTPQDAAFAHWWDYGYWVQTLGNRATLADGQYNGPWITHNLGRYLLTTPTPDSALSLMKSFNVSYLLIDPTDLGKYSAYSSIGSDEDGKDRLSWIPVMPSDERQTQETSNGTIKVYAGGSYLDGDIIYVDEERRVFLPEGVAVVGGIILEYSQTDGEMQLQQPKGVYFYNNKREDLPIRYLYYQDRLMDFGSGLNVTMMIIPAVSSSGREIDPLGAAIYLSEKTRNSLFAELYLMDDPLERYPTIEIAHSEDDYFVKMIKMQSPDFGDFLYNQGFRGPIKIWDTREIPEEIVFIQEMLSSPKNWSNENGPWGFFDERFY